MKVGIVSAVLVVAIFLALILEQMLPPIWAIHGARVLIVPTLFAYGAISLPFLPALGLAVVTGILSDLATLHVVGGKVEISLGWSILFYVFFGAVCQGLQPLFLRGRWELHAVMSLLGTVALLGLQFAMITLRRFEEGGFFFSRTVIWRIVAPGVIAMLLSPLLPLADHLIEKVIRSRKQPRQAY